MRLRGFRDEPTLSREEPIQTTIRRLSGLRYLWPSFSPSLERKFVSEAKAFQARRQWLEGLVAIALYIAFAIAREVTSSDWTKHERTLRFGIVLPLVLAVNASMLLRMGLYLRETGIVIASCVAGSVEVLLFGTHDVNHNIGPQLAIIAVLVFTNSVMRVRLPFATIVFGWGLCAEWFLLRHCPGDMLHTHALSSVMAMSIGVLTLTANYGQDREARLAFLKYAEKQELVGTLAQSNEQLAAAALTDSLTGLANRSAMDSYLTKVWSEPKLKELPCSVVMVDIDHFKNLNDRYGHLYGGRVLQRVAHSLAEALREENDFIARLEGRNSA